MEKTYVFDTAESGGLNSSALHLEMHICEALDINPYSEEAAHMSGDLAQLILEEALYSIVEL